MTNELDGLPKDLNDEQIESTYKTLKDMIAWLRWVVKKVVDKC